MSSGANADSAAPRGQRRPGLVIVVTAVVMAVSAAGVWAAWRAISHQSGAVPLIRADDRPVKVAPATPGGMTVPDQNIAILNGGQRDPHVEELLPGPETPLPRPMPAEPPPSVAAPAANPPAAAPLPAPPAPNPAVAVVPPPPAAAAPPAPPRAAPAAAATEGYRLQLGALRTEAAAQQEWARLKRVNADLLGRLEMRAARADLGARGVFYRIEAGPIADRDAAQHACDALKGRKVGCILVKP
jgi:cell division septation protein DedD